MSGLMENGAAAGADGNTSSADGAVKYEAFTIIEQSVHLDLAFREKQVSGTTTIKIFRNSDDLEYITLDARQCDIDTDGVTVNNQKVKVEYKDPYELMDTPKGYTWGARQHHLRTRRMKALQHTQRAELPMTGRERKGCQPAVGSLRIWLKPANTSKIKLVKTALAANTYEVTVPFQITSVRDGLHFVGVDLGDDRYPHAYTRHSIEPGYASCLFPCVDDRSRVELWTIALKFPRTVADALNQSLASQGSASKWVSKKPRNDSSQYGSYALTEEDKLLDMTAVCSGTLVGEHEDADDMTRKVMTFQAKSCGAQHIGFAIGPFEDVDLYSSYRTEEDEVKLAGNAIKIHGYCLPNRSDEVCNTCQPLANAADFFTMTFSKYPYDDNSYKICFLDDMVEDAVPLQGFSLISSRLLYPDDVIDTEVEVTRKLVHTIASQYFGVFINPNELTDTWIVVGLAYYMTDLYLRKLAGNNYYRYEMRVLAEHLTQVDHGRPSLHDLGRLLHLGDFEMNFMALKAPLVIFILDRRLMKSSNSSGVTRVISQHLRDAMQSTDEASFVMSSDKFRRQCEKKGRLRLEDFWDQWVFGSGCPRFHVTQRFNKKRLEVEVTVMQNQVKWSQEPHQLEKEEFWRDLVEERYSVEASEVPLTFTGPMTFRVHEADGTPYEHCLEIKLDAAATKGSRLSMPYNTKYKRIKRTRQNKRAKEQSRATRDPDRMDEDGNDDDDDKGHSMSTFGDVLVNDDDMAAWKLVDWDDDMQAQMDQESYEWIRVDCDFEWIYNLETNFKVYMTVAQLQQDRDVAGQVESMLTLTRNQPSNIQTTMLLRTLYDTRYFYGIRTMAANALTRHAEPANNFRGMHHLMRVFKKFFCYPDTTTPRPNDFSNKKEYYIQGAIPMALAKIRGGQAFCPQEARQLILDQLIYNNNEENPYSDQFYVAKLLDALAISLTRVDTVNGVQEGMSHEIRLFVDSALEQIERYEKMDGWAFTYKNIWVVTALNCKLRLMKSGVIPVDGTAFMKYAMTQNFEAVEIKAFEALIELGYLLKPRFLKLLLTEISTHHSPYVRDQLFKLFTRGLAAVAFGESETSGQRGPSPKPIRDVENAEGDMLMEEDDDGGLIVEQSDEVMKRRQDLIARQKDITVAIKALKEAVQDDEEFQKQLWKAIDSHIIGLAEKRNLLELCATLFPEEDEMMVTLNYPARWTVERASHTKGRVSSTPLRNIDAFANTSQSLILNFKQVYKVSLKKKRDEDLPVEPVQAIGTVPPVPVPEVVKEKEKEKGKEQPKEKEKEREKEKEKEKPEKKKIKLNRAGLSFSKNVQPSPAPSPAPVSRQPSIAVSTPRPIELDRRDTISVQNRPVVTLTSAAPSAAGSPTPEPSRPSVNAKSAKFSKKRKLAETEVPAAASRPNKKIVTMKYRMNKLTETQRQVMMRISSSTDEAASSDSIIASARTFVSTGSPLPRVPSPANATADVSMASFTSTLSAGSSSQKTLLPNGKPRKPLPSGVGSGSPPARPPPTPRSLSQSNQTPSGSASPVASRSSAEPRQPKKIIRLKLGTKALVDAASGNGSASSSQVSQTRDSPALPQAQLPSGSQEV